MNKISIYYKDTIMFDSGRNIYKSGIWEEILDELYIKFPVLRQQRDDWHQKELHCNEFMEKCFLPLYRRGIRTIIGKIKIGYKTVTTAEINNCGSYIDEHYYYVEVNNQVLYVKEERKLNYDYVLYKYEEGDWEKIMEDYLVVVKRLEAQKDREDGEKYISQLRKL